MRNRTKKQQNGNGRNGTSRGRRYGAQERLAALQMLADGGTHAEVEAAVGACTETQRLWRRKAEAEGTMPAPAPRGSKQAEEREAGEAEEEKGKAPSVSTKTKRNGPSPYGPHDPADGLGKHEIDAILELKKEHPSYGPAQIRAQLKRFKGWRVSIKAIAKVLKDNGYELVHRSSRPKGYEPVAFEAPRRNALWQLDFATMQVGVDKLHLLVALDDFSRFIVGHMLADSPTSEVAVEVLKAAISRHGKPEAVRTDRGGAFIAYSEETHFGRFLEAELINHIVGKSYRPQGGGKVESAIGTIRRELWDVCHFGDRGEAERKLAAFIDGYNHRRAHMGIDGLTPADRYFGQADKVLDRINAVSRRRQGALALLGAAEGHVEEVCHQAHGSPMEVLRLVIVDGAMELRFCGARAKLGAIEG